MFGKLKRRGHCHLAEFALARLLHVYREIDAIADLNVGAESACDLFFKGMEHGKVRV